MNEVKRSKKQKDNGVLPCVSVSLPTIEDINKFIAEHEGNTGNILLDKAVNAGFREGAKFVINWVTSQDIFINSKTKIIKFKQT
jgi:hypothetical protein